VSAEGVLASDADRDAAASALAESVAAGQLSLAEHNARLDALFAAPVVNGTAGLRVDIDSTNERMQKRIRDAQLQKIPYMLVVGEREAAEGKVAVRLRSGKDLGAMPLETFLDRIKNEAESRVDVAE